MKAILFDHIDQSFRIMSPGTKLSLEAIAVVDAIARHGSFAKAAAELHRVPSALSYTVSQLEAALGVQIFERSRQRTRLTPAGDGLLIEGRRLLRLAADAERRLTLIAGGWEAELRIAVDTLLGPHMVFPLIPVFDTLQSATRLSAREEALEGCWEALREDRADLIIAGLGAGGVPSGGGYDLVPLGTLAFDFAVAPGHPLVRLAAQLGRPLTEDEVHPFRAISVADSSRARSSRTYGLLQGQDTLTVTTMRDKLAAQTAGIGVGFLPRFLAEPAFQRGTLVRLAVAQPRPNASFVLAFRSGSLGNAGLWFVDQLKAAAHLQQCFA